MKMWVGNVGKLFSLTFVLFHSLWIYGHDFEADSIFYKRQGKDRAFVTYYEYGKYAGHVAIPSVVSFKDKKYEVVGITQDAFAGSKKLIAVVMPNSIEKMGYSVFSRCTALNSVVLSESVAHIPECTFYDCRKLTCVNIPEGVVSIGDMAFSGCVSLETITLPTTIKSLSNSVFFSCTNLKSVVCRAVSVPTLGRAVFNNIPIDEAVLYVPASALEEYKKADQWKNFGTILPME